MHEKLQCSTAAQRTVEDQLASLQRNLATGDDALATSRADLEKVRLEKTALAEELAKVKGQAEALATERDDARGSVAVERERVQLLEEEKVVRLKELESKSQE